MWITCNALKVFRLELLSITFTYVAEILFGVEICICYSVYLMYLSVNTTAIS